MAMLSLLVRIGIRLPIEVAEHAFEVTVPTGLASFGRAKLQRMSCPSRGEKKIQKKCADDWQLGRAVSEMPWGV